MPKLVNKIQNHYNIKQQECQTDTKYASPISGKFNGNDNIFVSRIFDLESR